MALDRIRKIRAVDPPRLLIYGPPGVGKTSLAAEFPAPVFIQVEDGTPAGLELDSFGHIETWPEVLECMFSLANGGHDYQTLVIDSLDKLEPLIWQAACEDNGWQSIEEPGYGKGYIEVDRYWQRFVRGLEVLRRSYAMNTVLIGHSTVVSWPNPSGTEFPRWDFRLHKRAHGIIEDMVDGVMMVSYDQSTTEDRRTKKVKSTGSQLRWIHCQGSPALNAKNRFGMPDKVLYQQGEAYASLAQYFPNNGNLSKAA